MCFSKMAILLDLKKPCWKGREKLRWIVFRTVPEVELQANNKWRKIVGYPPDSARSRDLTLVDSHVKIADFDQPDWATVWNSTVATTTVQLSFFCSFEWAITHRNRCAVAEDVPLLASTNLYLRWTTTSFIPLLSTFPLATHRCLADVA